MMFLLATVTALLVSGVHPQSIDLNPNIKLPRGVIEDRINATLEQLRHTLKNGVPEMGIRPFDPLVIEHWMYDTELKNIITANGSIKDLLLGGLAKFQTTHIKFDLFKLHLSIEIVLPKIDLTSQYDMTGTLVNFIPVRGEGQLGIFVENVLISFDMQLQILPAVKVKELKLLPDLDDLKFKLTGLMNDEFSKSLENTLNEDVKPIIKQNKEAISELISNYLKDLINEDLQYVEMDELFDSDLVS